MFPDPGVCTAEITAPGDRGGDSARPGRAHVLDTATLLRQVITHFFPLSSFLGLWLLGGGGDLCYGYESYVKGQLRHEENIG